MKKLLLLAILCIASISAFAKDDIIGDAMTSTHTDTIVRRNGTTKIVTRSSLTYDYIYDANRCYAHNRQTDITIPAPIMDRYLTGRGLFKGGVITLSVSAAATIVGSVLYLFFEDPFSLALTSAGGTGVSVGIPLMLSGLHLKKEANHEYEMLRDGYFLAPIPATAAPKTATETPSELPTPDL